MEDIFCPGCRMPISSSAVAAGICPCCEHSFREPATLLPAPIPAADTPPSEVPVPQPSQKRTVWPLAVGSVAAVVALAAIGVFSLLPPEVAAPTEQARETSGLPVTPTQPTAAKPAVPTAREVLAEPRPAVVAAAPSPMPEPPKPESLPKPEPKPDAGKVIAIDPADGDRKLDAPDATAELLPLDGDTQLTLTGRVKKLIVGSINGNTLLDASGLDAEEVVFAADLNGSPTVTVKAGVRVRFEKVVGGAVNLTANAPGGEVTFAETGEVNGGAVLTLTAKRVDAQALLTGGAKVGVTLTRGGLLRTRVMDGGATVEYKAASGNTEKLTVETGELRGGAKVTQK